MLALYVAVWSLATMSMGLVNGLAAIFFVRFLLGISQAGAYPDGRQRDQTLVSLRRRGRAPAVPSRWAGGPADCLRLPSLRRSYWWWERCSAGRPDGRRFVFAAYGALGLVWVCVFAWGSLATSPRKRVLGAMPKKSP